MKLFLMILSLAVSFTTCFAQNITQVEYFVDTDLGYGRNTLLTVNPSADGTFPFTANLTGVSVGYHKLYIRTKDSNGKWSITARRTFEVPPSQTAAKITAGEYFFDTDPGYGAASPINVPAKDTAVMQNFTATVTGLQPGYHKLYIRFKDDRGFWSLTSRRNAEVIKTPDSNYIKAVEYFIGSDAGVGFATKLSYDAVKDTLSQTFNIPLSCIKADSNTTIYLRVQDAKGNWSLTGYNTFKLTDKGIVTNIKSGAWSDASTWSNGKIPDANTAIYLDYDIVVDVNGVCKFLNTQCHNVTVKAGLVLQIKGTD